jgi:RNase P subunit RPR2
VVYESLFALFALRLGQRARNAERRLWFPSNRRKADPCFVAHVFKKWRDRILSRPTLPAPSYRLDCDFGHNNSSVEFVMQERKQFVVTCKDCYRAVPSGVKKFPFQSIVATCPLCGKQSRYRPSEALLGWPNQLVAKKRAEGMKA